MGIVVADTSPIRYLAEIGELELLPSLFERIFIPVAVYRELQHPSAPEIVRAGLAVQPAWLEVKQTQPVGDPMLDSLDEGERSAIMLGIELSAKLIVIDDRKGAAAARLKGFDVAGTLAILDLAARRGMIDLGQVLQRLRQTNFRARAEFLDALLKEHKEQARE